MTFRLLPRDARFHQLFVAEGENLLEAARRLEEMLDAYDRVEERVAEIQVLEHRGDEIDREIARRLEAAFVTPFDREDIHELTSRIDDVLDGIQSIAEIFVIYGIERPTEEARRMAAILAAAAAQLVEALRKLDRLKNLDDHIVEIHRLENEADGLSRAAVGRLFKNGEHPLEVIKWRDVYREQEEAIDAAEDAAEVLERMYHKGT
jgi:predicted phosphate transport protein (TIGR00153 family)